MNKIMRDTKFRGKPIGRKDFVYGSLVFTPWADGGRGAYFIYPYKKPLPGMPDNIEVDIETVSIIAKKTMNKEFYEGDIGRTNDEAKLIVVLVWLENYSIYAWLTAEEYQQFHEKKLKVDEIAFWTYSFADRYINDIDLIGNIHDNPELLMSKSD